MNLPVDLVDKLEHYPKIRQLIIDNWGTVKLDERLSMLLIDTDNGARKGFPVEICQVLIDIIELNSIAIEHQGISLETSPITSFGSLMWEVPKNF